jgi:HK97 family phage prohead protease
LTFELVLSAGSPVERGGFVEILDIAGATWSETIPLLDSHNRGRLEDQIGTVGGIRNEGGEIVATARLSKHSPLAQRVAAELNDGAKYGVSIGYSVQRWAESKPNGKRTLTAKAFEIIEASLVSIPANPAATIRSIPNVTTENTELTRAAINAEIRSIAKTASLDQNWIDGQTDADATLDQVRAAALDAMSKRSATAGTVRNQHNDNTLDNPHVRVRAAAEALYARSTPSHKPSEQARVYIGMGTIDLARDTLRHVGVTTTAMTPAAIVERALTTSDFPIILGDAVGRTLREAYSAAPSGLKRVARQTTAKDFRAKHRLQLSEAPRLEKVNEMGEYTSGSLAEAKESYALATYGKIIPISRQAIVNDDLHAFNDLARRMGQAAAATEAQLLVDLLVQASGVGPTMSDGNALFHAANHKNYAASGAALALDKLSAARLAMRKQTCLSGEHISIEPKHLVIPADLETTAEQLMTQIAATKTTDVNTLAGRFEICVEPRFTSATRWYVVADIASCDGLEYAYLEGEPGVQIETKVGFETDGVAVKARTDFGAGFVDWRSWYAANA